MKISIITATYNSAGTVEDTLKSIASQRYPVIEHIIVDGLSKDNTLDIVAKYSHVATVIAEKDKGIYDAMNKGIAAASGDVIGILNSDDLYAHDEVLTRVMDLFQNEEVQAVYGDLQYVAADNINKVVRTWVAGPYTLSSFYYGWMPPHPTFFVRREVYEKYGQFHLGLRTAADYEIMLRLLLKHQLKAAYIPELMVKMRAGGASNASLKHRINANKEDQRAWELNGLKPYFFTLLLKPLRKVVQFFKR